MTEEGLLNFDDLYLNAAEPDKQGVLSAEDIHSLRVQGVQLTLTTQAESFCREIVLFGKLPSEAYNFAFTATDALTGATLLPNNASYHARELLKNPEIHQRIRELRDEVVNMGGKVVREELVAKLKQTMLDPGGKPADSTAAAKALAQLEGFEKQPDQIPGGQIIINMPFVPQPLGQLINDD
jgi:hypothetical protein